MSNIRIRSLPGLKGATLSEPTPADLALINSQYSRVPLAADELHVRKARVAHNQHDRTYERFPKAILERFAETLPGKSLLPGHDVSELPLGRWFEAGTRTRTEEFPVVAGGAKASEIVPGMEPQKTRVTWLEAAFYFAADPGTELFRKNLDSGVYQDVSLGFSYDDVHCDVCRKSYWKSDCPHVAGQALDGGVVVTLTYAGDPKRYEARETSIVYLGAQQHAEMMKSLRLGTIDPEALARTEWGTDYVALKSYEALARERRADKSLLISPPIGGVEASVDATTTTTTGGYVGAVKGECMDLVIKALGLAEGADEQAAVAAVEAILAEKGAAVKREPLAKIGERALADLRDAIMADELKLSGAESADLMEVTALHVERANYDRLKALAAEKSAAVLVKFQPGTSGDTSQAVTAQEATARRSFGSHSGPLV